MKHEDFMQKALEEGRKGHPSPNPHVGAVLVKDDTIISVGHHERAGEEHAEIMAIRAAGDRARRWARGRGDPRRARRSGLVHVAQEACRQQRQNGRMGSSAGPHGLDAATVEPSSADLLQLIFDHAGEGIGVFDAEFRLSAWNDRFLAAFDLEGTQVKRGDRLQQVLGRPSPDAPSNSAEIDGVVRIDTPGEADYYRNGGILQYVLRNMLES